MKRMLVLASMVVLSSLAWALPSVQDVQAQVQAGHYAEAQTMMAEVVAAKPGSAKAHYLYAEILAHNAKFDQAAEQARLARQADPAIRFTDPAKFRAFEHLLSQQQQPRAATSSTAPLASGGPATAALPQSPTRTASPAPAPGWQVPGWAWVVGALALAWLAWKALARTFAAPVGGYQPAQAVQAMPVGAGPGYGPAYGNAYGPASGPGYGQAPGNTALKTGLAVAGGLAAGVMIDEMLHRGSHDSAAGGAAAASGLTGGAQPGFFDVDDSQIAARELERRDIDFGSGNDWDSGGGDAGSAGGGDDGGW